MRKNSPSFLFCLIMDVIGMASYFIPFLGEWFDVLWAPVSAFIFYRSFKGKVAKVGSIIDFLEEIFPFSDLLPTFTLAYIYTKVFQKK